ncbi:hypothetical protein [Actinophytocola gossypii]|uniref:Integral membrane protein n=1 Tax=Actinophytocola gossypii TaxID=2812003 RepID=A0ABT2J473_9PSEU|nr:hypothetical protein [Actinophytocola gossypii]MCT2582667.1 hypothetical protein [Actinophytocola gossypii]
MEQRPGRVSRVGTARALVLLGAVLAVGAAVLVCVGTLVAGPALLDQPGLSWPIVLAAVGFVVVVIGFAVVGSVLAARGRTVGSVVFNGCGTLLAGILVGITTLLLLISRIA